jgi:heme oxygenase (mycobilin-producing)
VILALSRFRVQNGMQEQVREAFVSRPRRVEGVAGFRGLEVYWDAKDESAFLLLTRWTDAAAFHAWHSSTEHSASHALMPPGLKLDPQGTELIMAERVDGATSGGAEGDLMLDLAVPLSRALAQGDAVHMLEIAADQRLVRCNRAFERAQGRSVIGLPFHALAAADCQEALSSASRAAPDEPQIIQFVDARGQPFSLRCHVTAHRTGFLVVGEPPWGDHARLEAQLFAINSELSVLMREHMRKTRELVEAKRALDAAHQELRDAHWHIKKLSNVLPICVSCHKVRTGEGDDDWEPLEAYVARSSMFLSHGYCTQCAAGLESDIDATSGKQGAT